MTITTKTTAKCDGPGCDFVQEVREGEYCSVNPLNVRINTDTVEHVDLCPSCEARLRTYLMRFRKIDPATAAALDKQKAA